MGDLVFVGGTVACGKTADLVIAARQLRKALGDNKVMVFKPVFDTRFPGVAVRSAAGLEVEATNMISETDDIRKIDYSNIEYILVDEIQFYTPAQVEQLREISLKRDINIICYGLIKDYKCVMFETSRRLIELCDEMKVLKSFCMACPVEGRSVQKSTCNMRINSSGKAETTISAKDSGVCIGGIETFVPVCHECYRSMLGDGLYSELINSS